LFNLLFLPFVLFLFGIGLGVEGGCWEEEGKEEEEEDPL
jgi:hypothetical protein